MPSLIPEGKQQYFNNAGVPLVGGKLYTYLAGTAVPKVTYQDADGTVPNTNPIILDARGEALVFWSGSYKVILKDALDNTIWTVDKVTETNLGYRTSSNGSAIIPSGTTAQRDAAPAPGYFRYNVDFGGYEGYYASSWRSFVQSINGTAIPNGGDVLLKTVGGVSIVGAGDIAVQAPLVSGTNIKTINSTSLLGAGDLPVQAVLVSGTNIKTVGGTTLLGAGNIPIAVLLNRVARVANTILGASDSGSMIDITSGTFTQTFTAAATLATGWHVYLRNSGTGDITLDPNGAELIDGLSSYIMYPGETRLIQCDGVGFTSMVLSPFFKKFTASGTFVKPPGYLNFGGTLWSAAGSGACGASAISPGGGGGSGVGYPFTFQSSVFGTSETITIGAGGTSVAATGAGVVGGTSSIGAILSCTGGPAGDVSGNSVASGVWNTAGTLTGYDFAGTVTASSNSAGAAIYAGGGGGLNTSTFNGQTGGNSIWGGGGGGGAKHSSGASSGAGGTSKFGGVGGAASHTGAATAGTAPAGGGGGSINGVGASGAGARGELQIWGIA